MSGTSLMPRILAALAAVTILAGVATPIHAADEVAVQAEPIEDEAGTLEALTSATEETAAETVSTTADGVSSVVSAAGDVLAAAANAVASVAGAIAGATSAIASAVATFLVASVRLLVDGLAWTGSAVLTAVTAVGSGLWWATRQMGAGLLWTGTTLASGIAAVTTWVVVGLHEAILWTGQTWPSDPARQAVAASAASGSAAAAGTAWYTRAWRYLKYVPGLAPLYSRIQPEELLDHPKRKKLYDMVKENPGIHLSEMSRELDASWGTLVHHLRKLEKGDLITSEDKRGKRCFFVPGQVTGAKKDILPALENEKARRIAEFYAENPGASQNQAAQDLGYSPALVSWHLSKLEDAGVVEREREGRRQRVGVTQEASAVVAA